MDSSSSRTEVSKKREHDIRRQITALQAQLSGNGLGNPTTPSPPKSPKRRRANVGKLLVPDTPSPRKKRKLTPRAQRVADSNRNTHVRNGKTLPTSIKKNLVPVRPAPSNVLTKLAGLGNQITDERTNESSTRSFAFSQQPSNLPSAELEACTLKRDERLALVENLSLGPAEHKPLPDDPHFQNLEPNSGIYLSSRIVSHEDLQEYLTARYYLSPSRLYSTVRLLPNKQGYDVPVEGDWVTIAVVAERGPIKFSRSPVAVGRDDGSGDAKPEISGNKPTKSKGAKAAGPTGKKYVNIKLVDLGNRGRSSSSASGGKDVVRGDALLSLLLFESDGFDLEHSEDGKRKKKIFKGGSKGAFEAMFKLKEGDVVALLNPKVLKPFQRATDEPHPTTNILAITPESAESILVLGRARDLGMCTVTKRDGKVCGSWCDKRVSEVCEWHIQNAVERRRAGRAEFSAGTMGLSINSAFKRKLTYDPARQWGLKPEASSSTTGESATYVVSGHIVGAANPYVSESMGREGQARAARRMEADEEAELANLLKRDKHGMQAVLKAREVESGSKVTAKQKANQRRKQVDDEDSSSEHADPTSKKSTIAYSPQVIKQLGFDPSLKTGCKRAQDKGTQSKLDELASVQKSRKQIILAPKPGPRVRSGVVPPSKEKSEEDQGQMIDLDDL